VDEYVLISGISTMKTADKIKYRLPSLTLPFSFAARHIFSNKEKMIRNPKVFQIVLSSPLDR
jgi:hypothetical protein